MFILEEFVQLRFSTCLDAIAFAFKEVGRSKVCHSTKNLRGFTLDSRAGEDACENFGNAVNIKIQCGFTTISHTVKTPVQLPRIPISPASIIYY